jgi:hypothetical protein
MYEGAGRDCHAKKMSGLLEYVAVAAGLNLIGQLQAMLLAMAIRISRSNQNWGSHTEFTVGRAGIKGVARRSLSAWRGGKPPDPPRTLAGLPARTCARINLNEVRNENPIRCDRCSGASGCGKPRTRGRAGAENVGR